MPKSTPKPEDEESFDPFASNQSVTEEERKKVFAIANPKKAVSSQEDNSAMLGDNKGKKLTTADRLRNLFQQHNFSPVTKILRRLKIEEAKIEAYERAENMGIEPRLLTCLPKPDKKAYYTLLLQLVRFELPELRSVEVQGQVEVGMAVHVIHHAPQQKVIRVDAGSPAKLRALVGHTVGTVMEVETAAEVIAKDGDDI
jgi:hypothetical protein